MASTEQFCFGSNFTVVTLLSTPTAGVQLRRLVMVCRGCNGGTSRHSLQSLPTSSSSDLLMARSEAQAKDEDQGDVFEKSEDPEQESPRAESNAASSFTV